MGKHFAVVLTALAVALPAQLLVVDPLGGGTHTDLQAAINAAPSGAVVLVRGGSWGALTITRSIAIVGENLPRVAAPLSGFGVQPAAITLQGTGSQTAVLAGLDVRGGADGGLWNQAGPGIASSGFAHVAVHDSTVFGHDWTWVTGVAAGASGIAVSGPATLHVVRSVVRASRAWPAPNSIGIPNGAHAIDAPSAHVVVLDSTVTGGDVDAILWQVGTPWPAPCPCGTPGQEPGRGGDGVVAQVVHASGGAIGGGTGSAVFNGVPPAPWGNQPNGVAIRASTQVTLPTVLVQGTPLRLGSVHTVTFPTTTLPSLFAIGSPLASPATVLAIQHVLVDPVQPLALQFLPVGATSFSLPVPANPLLLGHRLAEQRIDLTATGPWLATNPVLAVVIP